MIENSNNPRILREIAEQTFDLTEICPQYSRSAVGTANSFCIWHPNHDTPSGKLYFDEERGIVVFHCFAEHKTYTSYDYIDKILVQKKHKYLSVQDYLVKNLGESKFRELYTLAEEGIALEEESAIEQTIEYIDNLYNEKNNVIDFINCLYLEKE